MTARRFDAIRVVILGGYGVFGGRLARLLADEARLTLVIAGRSPDKACAFAAQLGGPARVEAAIFDRQADPAPQLEALAPDLLIDASGPFQAYGEGGCDPYALVRAAIARGIDYMDLADDAAFVTGIAALDAAAREGSVFALSGVSTAPVLTAAVVRRLAEGMARIDTIAGGIAPSPRVTLGLSLIRAIAGYAGRPVRLTRDGRAATAPALVDVRRYTIAPPGGVPLTSRRFGLVDVPDLRLLPAEWPNLRSVWFGVGTVPEPLFRSLGLLAWGIRLRLVPSLTTLAPLMHRAQGWLGRGEHRGGMFVEVTGADAAGNPRTRSWHLVAEGDDGPFIPAMAAEALVRRCLAGHRPAPGARAAIRELELADYDRLFARRAIVTGTRETLGPQAPLYQRLLGDAWQRLPEPLRRMHSLGGGLVAEGRASVERGRNPLARLVTRFFGFPPPGRDVPVRVRFTPTATPAGTGERWERDFGGRRFTSLQSEGKGRSDRLLVERFGVFEFGLALVVDEDRLRLVPRRWSAFGLPMPLWLAPGGDSFETVEDGRFRFHVEIRLPLAGLVVRYRGWLEPGPAPARAATCE